MLCALCQSIERPVSVESEAAAGGSADHGVCRRCGRALQPELLDRMTSKLAQLARFGLVGTPLLVRRRG